MMLRMSLCVCIFYPTKNCRVCIVVGVVCFVWLCVLLFFLCVWSAVGLWIVCLVVAVCC